MAAINIIRRSIACFIIIGILITYRLLVEAHSQPDNQKAPSPEKKKPVETRGLNLKQAIELAEIVNLDVLFSQERVREAAGISKTARSELLPKITSLSSATRQQRNSTEFGLTEEMPFVSPKTIGPYDLYDAGVTVRMPLINIQSIQNWRAALANQKLSQEELSSVREEARTLVASLYFEALRNQEALKAAEANVTRNEHLLTLAQDSKNVGSGTDLDVTRAEVQLSTAREQLESYRIEAERSLLELTNALGIDFDRTLKLLEELPFPATDPIALEAALELAFKQRPDLTAQYQRELMMLRKKDAAIAGRMPAVDVFGKYAGSSQEVDNLSEVWAIGVQITLPIWDSFKISGEIEQSKSQLAQTQNLTLKLKRDIEA
ncbi:MAG: TolC family protein, partial [Candidatus Margulisiibacteriota bacterium]